MPQFEITVTLPESFQYPVEVQRAFNQLLVYPVTKVVKVQPTLEQSGFDHLFTDTQALVDAVRYDSTPGSFEDADAGVIYPSADQLKLFKPQDLRDAVAKLDEDIPEDENHPQWCGLCCEVHSGDDDDRYINPRQRDEEFKLHDSVVRLEGAVTQLKRALEQTIQKMTP